MLAETRSKIDRNLIVLMLIGSIILVASDFGIIYVQANSINAGILEAMGTKFGTVWIARTIESFILLAISLAMFRKVTKKMPKSLVASPSKGEIISILTVGLTILATTSLIGHGAANGQVLPITIDFIHNLASLALDWRNTLHWIYCGSKTKRCGRFGRICQDIYPVNSDSTIFNSPCNNTWCDSNYWSISVIHA